MKLLFSLLMLGLLAGCVSTPPEQAQTKLQQAQPCCQQFSEFNFVEQALNQQTEYPLNAGPVFTFSQGKSYFIALQRPANSNFIDVTSWLNGMFITHANLIYPLVTVLDEHKNSIGTLRSLEDWHRGLSIRPHPSKGPYYTVRLSLPENARYLIVHADPNKLSETTPYTHRAPNGSVMQVDIRFNVAGRLTINFS